MKDYEIPAEEEKRLIQAQAKMPAACERCIRPDQVGIPVLCGGCNLRPNGREDEEAERRNR